jgi:hypothetical protein
LKYLTQKTKNRGNNQVSRRFGKYSTYLVLSGNLFPFENVDDILNPETQVKYEAKTLFSGANSKRILIQQCKPCPAQYYTIQQAEYRWLDY